MKPKIRTHYSATPDKGMIFKGKSLTVPDQSMTISQIIARTKKGLPITGVSVPLYNETEDGILPDLRNMDLSEIHELKRRMQLKETEIRKQLKQQEIEQQQKETEEYYKKKFGKTETQAAIPTEAEEIK